MAPIASAVTRVLVTGFGPFQDVPNNPSWAIASQLPASLPSNIELYTHPSAVPVAYHPVASLIPTLYASQAPDIALHIGVATWRSYFAVEQTSSKGVYKWAADVDGQVWTDAEGDAVWSDQPQTLSTHLDLDAVVAAWQERTANVTWPNASLSGAALRAGVQPDAGVDVRVGAGVFDALDHLPRSAAAAAAAAAADDGGHVRWSDAVGTYLCAFIYYTGMVQMHRDVGRRDTAFLHVPLLESDEEIDVGVQVTVELVQALVKSWREQRGVDGS